ncbi:MAG TPA: retropepsin-like aspartic protease [Candidatus Binatia bacterium]|nr:retropepsin-like aspartic protease [Candidatus Binatia bacterium]
MPSATRIPFISGHQLVLIPVVLNRTKAFRFIVDTGAQRVMISHNVAATLGLDVSHPIRAEAIVTAERQTPPAPVVRLDSVQIGGIRLSRLEASVFDLPPALKADGLLGLNFLREFRVTFEFDRSSLILRPRLRR